MESFNVFEWIPAVFIFIGTCVVVPVVNRWVRKKSKIDQNSSWLRQMALFALILFCFISFILAFPLDQETRKSIFNLLGIAVTAVIALSSTTFVGNFMSALMLRAVGSIRPGDFLTVGEHQGRVSEQGLLHTEIQTEERTLTTIPNLFLITNPHNVVRSTGTIISTTLSLGYDVSRFKIEKALKEAATRAGLQEPYVQVLELGDFSVTYRVAGFLDKVKFLITSKAKLRECTLDCLHEAGVEIVSPTFMNQRVWDSSTEFIPEVTRAEKVEAQKEEEKPVEDLVFDKAEEAETKEAVKNLLAKVQEKIDALGKELKSGDLSEEDKDKIKSRREHMENRKEKIIEKLESFKEED